jgi:DNA-binding response OmpR family regulator
LRRHKIDIVLLDYVLPGLDGLEVCRLVRQMSQQLPRIIIISGMNSDAIKSLALEVGANDYLEKPFETESLLDCVARHMAEAAILREA